MLTQSLTGQSLTTALGDLAYAGATDGWGRDAWGDNNWGENAISVSLTGVSATASLPDVSLGSSKLGVKMDMVENYVFKSCRCNGINWGFSNRSRRISSR